MAKADSESRTFVEFLLTHLESRFPWLGSEHEEGSGADAVAELNQLHEDLIQRRSQARRDLEVQAEPGHCRRSRRDVEKRGIGR